MKVSKIFKHDLNLSKSSISINDYSIKAGFTGFSSPAEKYSEDRIDLNKLFIKNSENSYAVRVAGDSMKNVGIFDEDILIIHTDLYNNFDDLINKIVIAIIDGEAIVKKIMKLNGKYYLASENENYNPIEINENMETLIRGVVTSIHRIII